MVPNSLWYRDAQQLDIFPGHFRRSMFVRSVGSVPKSGPVRSGLRSRIGLALISVRIGPTKIFEKLDRVVAIDFVQESSKSEPSSRFLSRSKLWKFTCHFLANSADRPGIYIETPYKSNFPWDVCLNSSKSGETCFGHLWLLRHDIMLWWDAVMMLWC